MSATGCRSKYVSVRLSDSKTATTPFFLSGPPENAGERSVNLRGENGRSCSRNNENSTCNFGAQ
jgi:hypothetical protein